MVRVCTTFYNTKELCILSHSVLVCSVRFLQLIPAIFRNIIKWLVFLTKNVFAPCGVGMEILDKTDRNISLKKFDVNPGYIHGVTGGRDQTSGGCSLCETIPKNPKTPISKVERFGR